MEKRSSSTPFYIPDMIPNILTPPQPVPFRFKMAPGPEPQEFHAPDMNIDPSVGIIPSEEYGMGTVSPQYTGASASDETNNTIFNPGAIGAQSQFRPSDLTTDPTQGLIPSDQYYGAGTSTLDSTTQDSGLPSVPLSPDDPSVSATPADQSADSSTSSDSSGD